MSQDDLNESRARIHQANADLNHTLERRGDRIAQQNGWSNVSGFEAIKYFLMQRHHWTPAQLDAMSIEQLRFAMLEEKDTVIQPRA